MKTFHSALGLALVMFCAGSLTEAASLYTYVPIPFANNNISTGLISVQFPAIFTPINSLATPFKIIGNGLTNCGPFANADCNFYDGFGFSGSGNTVTLNVSVYSPTDVYTLMNAYNPTPGLTLATVQFIGTGGTSETFALVGGSDIRDFYQGSFPNTLTNGVAGVTAVNAFSCVNPTTCEGAEGTGYVRTGQYGNYVIDEQDFSLGNVFAGQTLTQIVITDVHNGSDPILLGVTIGSVAPEPSSLPLLGLATSASVVRLARRRKRKA